MDGRGDVQVDAASWLGITAIKGDRTMKRDAHQPFAGVASKSVSGSYRGRG
jgi:hypothetical protein